MMESGELERNGTKKINKHERIRQKKGPSPKDEKVRCENLKSF